MYSKKKKKKKEKKKEKNYIYIHMYVISLLEFIVFPINIFLFAYVGSTLNLPLLIPRLELLT